MEIWKPIPYSPHHLISNYGRMKSIYREIECKSRWGGTCIKKIKSAVLKPFTAGAGYLVVCFKEKGKKYYMHRLVAEIFVDGDTSLHVNHKDGDKTNNYAENLEWVTRSQNSYHSTHILGNKSGQFIKPECDKNGRWTGKGIRHA